MLDPRLRQLHDEPRSGGNQSAHQRMINRRFNDRASCFAQRRLYCEGNAKKGGEDFLRLLLETANIRALLWQKRLRWGFPNRRIGDSWLIGFWRADHGGASVGLGVGACALA